MVNCSGEHFFLIGVLNSFSARSIIISKIIAFLSAISTCLYRKAFCSSNSLTCYYNSKILCSGDFAYSLIFDFPNQNYHVYLTTRILCGLLECHTSEKPWLYLIHLTYFCHYMQFKKHRVDLLSTPNILTLNLFFHNITFCVTLFQDQTKKTKRRLNLQCYKTHKKSAQDFSFISSHHLQRSNMKLL
jgi:hypothetical protein